jgi:polar amino acid transport system substrate-binding protein
MIMMSDIWKNAIPFIIMLLVGLSSGFSGCLTTGPTDSEYKGPDVINADSGIALFTEEQPPYNFITNQGYVSGSSTEIVREIAKRTTDKISITLVTWDRGIETVMEKPNTALFSTVRTNERESEFKWVGPIATVELVVYGKKDFPIITSNISDLKGSGTIAVVRNDVREDILRESNLTDLLVLPDDYSCIEALERKNADLWFGTSDIFAQSSKTLSSGPDTFKKVCIYMNADIYIAFNRDTSDETIQKWQQALDSMKDDGTYDMIVKSYLPFVCSWSTCIA